MKDYIKTPIKNSYWNPMNGDFNNVRIALEEKNYRMKQKRKKAYITLLIFSHILLLSLIFLAY